MTIRWGGPAWGMVQPQFLAVGLMGQGLSKLLVRPPWKDRAQGSVPSWQNSDHQRVLPGLRGRGGQRHLGSRSRCTAQAAGVRMADKERRETMHGGILWDVRSWG